MSTGITVPSPAAVTIASTAIDHHDVAYTFVNGTNFVQQFRAAATGRPRRLELRVGAYKQYGLRITISREQSVLFQHNFFPCAFTSNETTVLDLTGFSEEVYEGQWLKLEVQSLNASVIRGLTSTFSDVTPALYFRQKQPMVLPFKLEGTELPEGMPRISFGPGEDGQSPFDTEAVVDLAYPWGRLITAQTENTRDYYVLAATWDFSAKLRPVRPVPVQPIPLMEIVQTQALGLVRPYPAIAGQPAQVYPTARNFPFFVARPGITAFEVDVQMQGRSPGDSRTDTLYGLFESIAPFVTVRNTAFDRIRVIQDGGVSTRVQFGNYPASPAEQRVGATLNMTAALPADSTGGLLAVIQVVRGFRNYTKADGTVFSVSTNGEWYLDRSEDDGEVTYAGRGTQRRLAGTTAAQVTLSDAPSVALVNGVTRIEVNDEFRTYLVYKPAVGADIPSRWVPLGYYTWSWRFVISRPTVTAAWPRTLDSSAATTADTAVWTDSYEFPSWTNVSRTLIERIRAGLGQAAVADMPEHSGAAVSQARQMLIGVDGGLTTERSGLLVQALDVPLSNHPRHPNDVLVWSTPEVAERARRFSWVNRVEELPVADRYSAPDPRHPSPPETYYQVRIAPYTTYHGIGEDGDYAAQRSPAPLQQVGAALVQVANEIHIAVSVDSWDETSLNLHFLHAPSDDVLLTLAAHPQVALIERDPHFHG